MAGSVNISLAISGVDVIATLFCLVTMVLVWLNSLDAPIVVAIIYLTFTNFSWLEKGLLCNIKQENMCNTKQENK